MNTKPGMPQSLPAPKAIPNTRKQRHAAKPFQTNWFWCESCDAEFQIPAGDMHEPTKRFMQLLKLRHDANSENCKNPKVHFLEKATEKKRGKVSIVYFRFRGEGHNG